MKQIDGVVYLTIGELAKQIERTVVTIKYWMDWYAEQEEEIQQEFPLPEFRRDLDSRGTRFVEKSEVPKFIKFRNSMVYGKIAFGKKQKKIMG